MDPEVAEFARSYRAFTEAMTAAAGGWAVGADAARRGGPGVSGRTAQRGRADLGDPPGASGRSTSTWRSNRCSIEHAGHPTWHPGRRSRAHGHDLGLPDPHVRARSRSGRSPTSARPPDRTPTGEWSRWASGRSPSTAYRWSGCSARRSRATAGAATRSRCCRRTLGRPRRSSREVRRADGAVQPAARSGDLLRGAQLRLRGVRRRPDLPPPAGGHRRPGGAPGGGTRAGHPARGRASGSDGTRCAPPGSTSNAACCSTVRRAPARPTWSGTC